MYFLHRLNKAGNTITNKYESLTEALTEYAYIVDNHTSVLTWVTDLTGYTFAEYGQGDYEENDSYTWVEAN